MQNSITHHHLCAVINTEIERRAKPSVVRVLDMGCGNGHLIAFLQHKLPQLRKDLKFEIYGFDVIDSNIQASDYFEWTFEFLGQEFPNIDWKKRVFQIVTKQEWPFPAGFFDYIISNQVMEHVFDHDFSFQQIKRVLANDGVSIHLFPLRSYVYEGHLLLPFVHWISNKDLLFDYIKVCSLLGLGKYRRYFPMGSASDLNDFCQKHTDYMIYETNYLSPREVYKIAKRNLMRCSFRYTEDYYFNKLRQVFRKSLKYEYALIRHPWWERILFTFLVRLSSITLVLENGNTYVQLSAQH